MRVLAMSALVCALVPGLSAMAEAQSLKKLRRCLEFKDMTMPRLICFNRFVENPARPVAPEKQAEPVAPKATPAAPKPVEPTER